MLLVTYASTLHQDNLEHYMYIIHTDVELCQTQSQWQETLWMYEKPSQPRPTTLKYVIHVDEKYCGLHKLSMMKLGWMEDEILTQLSNDIISTDHYKSYA